MAASADPVARRRAAVAIALIVATLVMVTVVASGGRVPIATEGSGGLHLDNPAGTVPDGSPATAVGDGSTGAERARGSANVLEEAIAFTVGAIALMFIARIVLRKRPPPPGGEDLGRDAPAIPLPELVDDTVEWALAALASGETEDVIVACWVRLEEAAAAAGVARAPAEAPAELAARVLAELGVPRAPVDTLLRLFRTARFSRRHLGETDRAAAVSALEAIRSSIAGARA